MLMLDISPFFPITDPTLIFLLMLCIILSAPIIMGRLRIPHIVGMILAGIIIGPNGFNLLARDSSFELFGKVGLYYIMLLAGLEMNMSNFRKNKIRTSTHGVLAFAIPMAIGLVVNIYLLKFGLLSSVLLASLYASHTLIAYPIVLRYGISEQRSVTIAVGATAITDTLTLIVLAIVSGMFKGEVNTLFWVLLAIKISVVFFVIIYFFPRIARFFFQRYEDGITQFIFVLGMTFLGAWLMELIGMEGLLGAFVTGLVINRYVPNVSPLMMHLEFVGNALFIPYFLIGVGMLVNVRILFGGIDTLTVAFIMITVALASKWIASLATQKLFGMSGTERELIFGLSNAQAGATLAAVLVGYNLFLPDGQRLLNDDVLNGTIILILVTCILSSITTERASKQIVLTTKNVALEEDDGGDDEQILIPVARRNTAVELAQLGIFMRNKKLNRGLIGVYVVVDTANSTYNHKQGEEILEEMEKIARSANVGIITQNRISTNVSSGIKHAFMEYRASEIIMGVRDDGGSLKNTWGSVAQNLYTEISKQIIIVRCLQPINTVRRIQVAVPSRAQFESGFYRWLERLSRLSENLECRIQFHGRSDTLELIKDFIRNRHPYARAEYASMEHWNELPRLANTIAPDHLFVVVTARKGTVSYKSALERLPDEIIKYFRGKNIMIIYPDQCGESVSTMTYAVPQPQENRSAYEAIRDWWEKLKAERRKL